MKKLMIILLIFVFTPVLANDHFFDNIKNEMLSDKTIWSTWKSVDRSKYCYRKHNLIYKNNKVVASTPLIPFIHINNISEKHLEAIDIIHDECF